LPGDFLISGTVVLTLAFWCFALLHSTMVALRFQARLEGRIGKDFMLAFYRLGFTVASGLGLFALALVVHHLPNRTLYATSGSLSWALRFVQVIGLGLLLLSARRMDLLKFIGVRQAIHFLRPGDVSEQLLLFREEELDTSGMYGLVRHPQYLSVLVMMWAAPAVSLTYLTIAVNTTLYFCIGSYLEERRLVAQFGQMYVRYQRQVPRVFPWRWLLTLPQRLFCARQDA
jgi:protein-S-isoprenylcysteine O-methyltransferase Ste14